MKLKQIFESFSSPLDFFEALRKEVVRLASENPDFRYNTSGKKAGCSYNGPAIAGAVLAGPECKGCIFGQALQNMGWTDSIEMNYGGDFRNLIKTWISNDVSKSFHSIITSLQEVQNFQDNGSCWKYATAHITDRLPNSLSDLKKAISESVCG